MVNPTTQRVPLNTANEVNERVRRETERRIAFYAAHPELIDGRLAELDREWDVERLIEVEAPTMTITGLLLGVLVNRKWLVIPLFAQCMVFLHSVQGWYPLLPVFRRMGIRTEREIAIERYALKTLRGDFADAGQDRPEQALQAAR
jgi:hypothetical protein